MPDPRPFPGVVSPAPLRGRLTGWLALVVALAALGVSAWQALESREAFVRQAEESATRHAELRSLHRQLQQAADERQALQRQVAAQQSRLESLTSALSEDQQRQWLVQEVGFYLDLAEEHLQLQQDVEPALRLLAMTDSLLEPRHDSRLVPLRAAIAADRLTLVAAGQLDKTGISLRIDALKDASTRLAWPLQAGQPQPSRIDPAAARPARESLWEKGWRSFRDLITIRHYDRPVRPLLGDDQRWLLQQNVYLELTQAQQALWRNQPDRYRQSLRAVRSLLNEFGHPVTASEALEPEIAALEKLVIPDIPVTLPESRKAVAALMQIQGAAAEPPAVAK